MEDNHKKILELIESIDNKDFDFYFYTLDTKGNPTAAIANIYEHVKVLNDLGYRASILHDKNDYQGVGDWLGETYAALPHCSIESQDLNLKAIDYLIVPEIFSNVMESVKQMPCKKIVLSQSYTYILELLKINERWDINYGFWDVITTTDKQASYIKELFPRIKTHVINPAIPEYFKSSTKIKKPVISILTRDQKEALSIVKSFYLRYPMYKWVTFRELRGLPRKTFAETLGESCLAVWVDEISSFGTFPLEAIQCDTPVIGKIPEMIPEWMQDESDDKQVIKLKNNGIWTNSTLAIPDLIADYMKAWLDDSLTDTFLDAVKDSKDTYTKENEDKAIEGIYSKFVSDRKVEFETILKIESEKTK
jgi:hypothetical protein|tara:strand:- start:8293 stop:9384 length:1092 start_codon:yes stop_codon:yes gene_type:complete